MDAIERERVIDQVCAMMAGNPSRAWGKMSGQKIQVMQAALRWGYRLGSEGSTALADAERIFKA